MPAPGHVYLESAHAKLKHALAEIDRLTAERDFHNAAKIEATRQRNEKTMKRCTQGG